MNGTFGGKKGRSATSSELLRAVRIGVEAGANSSYETNLKKKRSALGDSSSILDRLISGNIVASFANTTAVVNPYVPRGVTFLFTQRLAANGLPVGQTWSGAASSYNGSILFICSLEGYVSRSADSGLTWSSYQYTPGTQYTSVSISFDGGLTYTKINSYPSIDALTTGDGKYIASMVVTGSDCALTIARLDPAPTIFAARVFTGASTGSIVGNQNGTYFAASANNGDIYTLSDITTNVFTLRSGSLPAATPWTNITMSTDLTNRLAVCSSTGLIYTSPDGGVTWVARTAGLPAGTPWINITMSADGTKLAVCSNTGFIYTSFDSGVTWRLQTNGLPSGATWKTIRYNSDATKLIVVSTNGIVCTAVLV